MVRDLLQSWVSYVFGGGMFSIAVDFLDINPSTGNFATIWRVVSGVYNNVCVPIGMGLVLIYFMVNLIERSMQQQQLDVEQVIKLLLKLVIGLYFIENGLRLMTEIYSLGFSFLDSIISAKGGDYSAGDAIAKEAWKSLTGEEWEGEWNVLENFTKSIPIILQLILPYIFSWVIQLICLAVCAFRLIEFYIMTCTAPIALSDFFTEGVHGNGWRFVKNYIAMALQMGIVMLAIVAFNGIVSAFLPKTGLADLVVPVVGLGKAAYFILVYLAVGASCAGVMLKSRSLAKDIVGVN